MENSIFCAVSTSYALISITENIIKGLDDENTGYGVL